MATPIELEVFNKLFASVAEEMGIVLRRSAFSANIKERRDFSCALFDRQGLLLAQAAHIPVHLGAMPLAMAAAHSGRKWSPGDVVILNDPYKGGTHLPDITLIAPVYCGEPHPLFFVAARAHHADVGGIEPGSMPVATDIRQEGVIIPPTRLVRAGSTHHSFLEDFLRQCRSATERQGDLDAQLAALRRGSLRLEELVARHGRERLEEMGAELLAYSQRAMRRCISRIPDGIYQWQDLLDDDGCETEDIAIHLRLTIRDDQVEADFTQSSAQVKGGVNAVRAVTRSALVYVFLCLLDQSYPINHGCFEPLTLHTRPGTICDAKFPAPVAAGNVETSQRLVDVLLGALAQALPGEIPAASCGSMNNVAIGNPPDSEGLEFTYYETIGGGMGARRDMDGLDGVHTHMTNTLNTPVEAIEHSYPLLIETYRLIPGSGGRGRYRGGRGIRRDYRFLAPARVSLLSERRRHPPPGTRGGEPGRAGENILFRKKKPQRLPGKVNLEVLVGDLLSIRTPGGGGFGRKKKLPAKRKI